MSTTSIHVVVSFAFIVLVWFVQPWWLHWALRPDDDDKATRTTTAVSSLPSRIRTVVAVRLRLGVVFSVFVVSTITAALHLHQQQERLALKPIVYIMLGYPQAMQCIRYLHALAVGSVVFDQHFGLQQNLARMKIFMWCPPTVIFKSSFSKHDDEQKDAARGVPWKADLQIALMDIVICFALCATGVMLQLDIWLPELLQQMYRMYIMAYSTSILKVVLECPPCIVSFPCIIDLI